MSSLSLLVNQRGYKRTQVTKLYNKVKANIISMNVIDRTNAVSKLEQLSVDIKELDAKINSINFESDVNKELNFEEIMDECDSYEDKIIETLTIIKTSYIQSTLESHVDGSDNSNFGNAMSTNFSRLKLPEVPLPFYSHAKDESLDEFLRSFESIINKYSISTYEKFCLLKNQLKGEPLILVNSLSVSQQSYEEAKKLLEQAFASDTTKKFDAIARLAQLKLEYNGNAYEYVGEMRTIECIFRNLVINIEDVLQFFFWSGMNTSLQTQLVNICNTNKPSLSDINENIFKAIDRYVEISNRNKARKDNYNKRSGQVNSFAVNVNSVVNRRTPFCTLCTNKDKKETSHSTKDCTVFPDPKSKTARLNMLGACVKCGYINHRTNDCKFVFKNKCIHCEKDHMAFLCTNFNTSNEASSSQNDHTKKNKNSPPKNVLSSNVVCTSALKMNVGSNVLLPTFVCKVNGINIRGMKDSGSQPHFIKSSIAKELNLHVLNHNFAVTVSGFNESHDYVTKIVRVELYIGNNIYEVEAICIPDIRTKLCLPGLTELAREFLLKGYDLADSLLSDGTDLICNLDFILGNSNPEILMEKQIKFGSDNSSVSVISETEAGVLLYGDLNKLIGNISLLPNIINSNVATSNTFHNVFNTSIEIDRTVFDKLDAEVSCNIVCDVNNSYNVIDNNGKINDRELNNAANDILNYDTNVYREDNTEVNTRVVNYILSNTTRTAEGRFCMPLPWKNDALNHLGSNYRLSLQILKSSLNKMSKSTDKLVMVHNVFIEQENAGIIERVDDLDQFLKIQSNYSFLPHMSIFKLDRATTKCRVVFLSNLCEIDRGRPTTFSHNQTMHAGPSLNQKITTALLHLRFGEKLLTYDLKKAFNQISLYDNDANKLLFLWFKDPLNGDFTPIAYRNIRLSFGLRASPCILMLALYKLLCVDIESDDAKTVELKRMLYALLYMDNGAFTGTVNDIQWAYGKLNDIFEPYKFSLQQITTNEQFVQEQFDKSTVENTPEVVKLLGLQWNRFEDKLIAPPINLDIDASSKRQVLQTIAAQYDVFNYQGPLMNRSRLFLHKLQCDSSLSWDSKLVEPLLTEWRKIVKQANKSPPVCIDRFVGDRSDRYELICFTDASSLIYASVVYIKNLKTSKVSFLRGKHRLVNKQLALKTIPTLELQAVTLGVESILEVKRELSGSSCIFPINIVNLRLFTDSMICLHWINSYTHKLEKMQKQSIFVMNRLDYIVQQCTTENSITFGFVVTNSNTADCLSRAISYKIMMQSKYIEGPDFLKEDNFNSLLDVIVPNPLIVIPDVSIVDEITSFSSSCSIDTHLIPLDKYSNFKRYVNVHCNVLLFLELLKYKVAGRRGMSHDVPGKKELTAKAVNTIITVEQKMHFNEEYNFLKSPSNFIKDIPPIVSKMNLFLDLDGLLKVKCKFDRFSDGFQFPIILPKNSLLTELVIRDTHENLSHIGCYNLINHLRKRFYIKHIFSTVKKILKKCTICQRMNGRTVKLNQNSYRDHRVSTPCVPYKFIYIDYLGPFYVKVSGKKVKVWLLLLTCLWSRSVNIKVCKDLSVSSFMKAFQCHVYEEGLPSQIYSDLGSQITVAGSIIQEFLSDVNTRSYLVENNIDSVKFEHYFKGNSSLGSIVEICVKFVKRLLYGAIKNSVLDRDEFDLIICKTVYLINSRPIAFKNVLTSNDDLDIPEPITPELLKKGRNLLCINVVPALKPINDEEYDPNWINKMTSGEELNKQLSKLRKVQSKLVDLYNAEFMATLIAQSVDKDDRYKPIHHEKLCEGDIILLKEPLLKFHQYPMAVVHKVYENCQGEVTDVEAFKGKTRELVKRHVTAVVPYLRSHEYDSISSRELDRENNPIDGCRINTRKKSNRKAAVKSRKKTKVMLEA